MRLCDIISKHSESIKGLKIDSLIRGGLTKFSEQVGRLWTTLADYYIRQSHFEKVSVIKVLFREEAFKLLVFFNRRETFLKRE
jgi:hypothetical protein